MPHRLYTYLNCVANLVAASWHAACSAATAPHCPMARHLPAEIPPGKAVADSLGVIFMSPPSNTSLIKTVLSCPANYYCPGGPSHLTVPTACTLLGSPAGSASSNACNRECCCTPRPSCYLSVTQHCMHAYAASIVTLCCLDCSGSASAATVSWLARADASPHPSLRNCIAALPAAVHC